MKKRARKIKFPKASCGKRKGCFVTALPHLGLNKIKHVSKIAA